LSTIRRWDFETEGGAQRLHDELRAGGAAWVRAPALVAAAEREPGPAATTLLGERPALLERQPIRPVPGGRSFASGSMAAPFHSDSQSFLGVPPHVQVMACLRASGSAGESLYLDSWALLERIASEDPALFGQLFEAPRRLPFVFGDVFGPTVSLRGGSLVFTHTAFPEEDDEVAARLRPFVETAAPIEVRAEAGDLLVIHNHRMLHGRRAFDDAGRAFMRLLAWRREPYPAPAAWLERARRVGRALEERLRDRPPLVRARFGAAGDDGPEARRRLQVVLDLLQGVPPGVVSAREGTPEPRLYSWRDAALAAALQALGENAESAGDEALRAVLADLRRSGSPGDAV
jgi:hypothetical protein